MRPFSIAAIYILFWVLSAFTVLPFGLRTPDQAPDETMVKGQASSAPVNFRPGRVVLRATILATLAFALFYANFQYGWLTFADIDFTRRIVP